MKKILSIALVALLVASTAFAGFSGKATLSLGYDTTSKAYGMANGKGTSATVELAAETAEVVGEGDIYAGIKATMQVAVKPSTNGAAINIYDTTNGEGFGIWFSVKEAYVAGADWKVNILGGKGAPDYAVSAIDGEYKKNVKDAFGNPYDYSWVARTYKVSAWNGAGITASFKDWTVAGGFKGVVDDYLAFNAFIETPAIAFEVGSVKAAALVARDGHQTNNVYDALDKTNVAVSAKADYTVDAFSAAVAADFGFENVAEDAVFNFDAAANVAYSPVAVDVYFSRVTEKNYLSAKVSGTYEGISGKIFAKDILAESKDITIGAEAEYTIDAVTVGAGFEMTTDSKKMKVSGNVEYAAEKFTAKAGAVYGTQIDVEDTAYFYATASVESSAIINGATISLSYGADSDDNDMNFLGDQKNFGAITAKCVIAF